MSAFALFALLTLGAASPFRADAQQTFKDCQASANGPNGRFYGCPDWNSSITALPGNSSMGGHELELVRSSTRATLPGEVREAGQIKLKGGDFPALVFVPADKAGAAAFGFAEATMKASPRGLRLVTCISQTDGKEQRRRCKKALEYLVVHGTPDGANIDTPASSGQPAILSHRLEVPAGCKVDIANEVAGRIQCDSSMLSWNTIEKRLVPSTKRWLDELIPALVTTAGGGFTVEHLPCKVEGELANCGRLTKQGISDPPFSIYAGTTVVGDHAVMVACGFLDEHAGFPPVCNNTLSLP